MYQKPFSTIKFVENVFYVILLYYTLIGSLNVDRINRQKLSKDDTILNVYKNFILSIIASMDFQQILRMCFLFVRY
jgi:hypothetical protein